MMKRSNGYKEFDLNYSYLELVSRGIISLIDRNKTSFYLNQFKLFFKDEDNCYLELVGYKIANYLGIRSVSYDLARIVFNDRVINGVVSEDFREEDYNIVNFNTIFNDYMEEVPEENIGNEMNLEFIYKVLNYRYRNYNNSQFIVHKIMDELINYFMLDMLIGNYDNGKYNYEIMENDRDAKNCPYYDFGNSFVFKKTRFTVSDSDNYDIYDNLLEFLFKYDCSYVCRFIDMFNKLSPSKLEEIFVEIENDIDYKLDVNFKNILFLAYSRHYEKISDILIKNKMISTMKK